MNNTVTLSKSDFQLGSACLKKLIYKKSGYPTTNDTNEYMEMLAQGGYIVGKMATLYYEDGIEIEGFTKDCIKQTEELLQRENVTLFEPAIQSGQKIVRIDILIKEGNNLHLIEVKAKSYDSTDSKTKTTLKKYIEDVAYQYSVLSEKYPDYKIHCSLFMPDKSIHTEIDGLAGWFKIQSPKSENDNENEDIITQIRPVFRKPSVVFKYENTPEKAVKIEQLKSIGILSLLDVTNEVIFLQPMIIEKTNNFLRILNDGISDTDYKISKGCKGCEFNTPEKEKNGYKECWGEIGYKTNHLFDLYYGGTIKNQDKQIYIDELIDQRKTDLFDIDVEMLKNPKGEIGKRAERQVIQIKNTKENKEWISEALNPFMNGLQYPLHFIDFETYTGAVPYHKHMRPYELIAFQWSCHTIKYKGAEPEHTEWIHTGEMFPNADNFPNFEFAITLMKQIGKSGTPLMWATHENTVLRTILHQMESFNYQNEQLKDWLTDITSDKETGREGRLIDMNKMTLQYYFHPYMKGKTSIKKVLPAVWSNFPELHQIPFFKEYAPERFTTGIIDPYDTLKAINTNEDIDEDDVVSGGTDAMRAYQRIRFDENLSIEQRDEIRRQLLQYCKLDTMAMVIIANHWGLK
jgi:hypothetical protein